MQITVHENEQHTQAATPLELNTFTDGKGRVFVIKKPGILAQARFERLFGADNNNYRMIMTALAWVESIDGEKVPTQNTILQYEALLQRVGEEGLMAIVERISQMQDGEPHSGKDDVKNS